MRGRLGPAIAPPGLVRLSPHLWIFQWEVAGFLPLFKYFLSTGRLQVRITGRVIKRAKPTKTITKSNVAIKIRHPGGASGKHLLNVIIMYSKDTARYLGILYLIQTYGST